MKKSLIQLIFLIFLFITFGIGAYVYSGTDMKQIIYSLQNRSGKVSCMEGVLGCQMQEGFWFGSSEPSKTEDATPDSSPKEDSSANCYDLLIRRGNQILMYNTKEKAADKTNPVVFTSLSEYEIYLDEQRKKGIRCPILYLQQEAGTQGEPVYRLAPNPFENANLANLPLTASLSEPSQPATPIKTNTTADRYASFDPMGLHVGKITDLDVLHESTQNQPVSDNPMDPNWGGVLYTQQQIDSGKYDENIVTRVAYPRAGAIQVGVPNTQIASQQTRDLNLARTG